MIIYISGYILTFIFLVVWLLKRAVARSRSWPSVRLSNEDKIISVFLSFAMSFVWPIIVIAFGTGYFGIWLCDQILKVMVKKKWI